MRKDHGKHVVLSSRHAAYRRVNERASDRRRELDSTSRAASGDRGGAPQYPLALHHRCGHEFDGQTRECGKTTCIQHRPMLVAGNVIQA
jgi:hypothetical protein